LGDDQVGLSSEVAHRGLDGGATRVVVAHAVEQVLIERRGNRLG
jgi:hypothetical protein